MDNTSLTGRARNSWLMLGGGIIACALIALSAIALFKAERRSLDATTTAPSPFTETTERDRDEASSAAATKLPAQASGELREPHEAAQAASEVALEDGRFRGRLLDLRSGLPVEGARIELTYVPTAGGVAPIQNTVSAVDGSFTFESFDCRAARLHVNALGYRAEERFFDELGTEFTIDLTRFAGQLKGRVSSGGSNLGEALIRIHAINGEFTDQARSNGDGSYQFATIPDDGSVDLLVAASAPGCATVAHSLRNLGHAELREINFDLSQGRLPVTIEVFNKAGAPIESALVECKSASAADANWIDVARTAADGRARLQGLPLTSALLSVRADGYLDAELPLTDSGEEWGEDLQVALEKRGTVSGQLVDAEGVPIQGRLSFRRSGWPDPNWKHVRGGLRPRPVWSEVDGSFEVDSLLPQTPYGLVLDAPGHAPTSVQARVIVAPAAAQDLGTLWLERGRSIAGTVLVDAGAKPSSVQLGAVATLKHGGVMTWRDVLVNDDGTFELSGMPLGEFTLRGKFGEIERDTSVLPGQAYVEIDFGESAAPWTLRVHCVDLDGLAVEGVPLSASFPNGNVGADALEKLQPTASPGLYELQGVTDPLLVVAVEAGSRFLALDGEVRIHSSDPNATIRVERAIPFSGRVVGQANGRAIADAKLSWVPDDTHSESQSGETRIHGSTNSNGEFSLDLPVLRAGELLISAAGYVAEKFELEPIGDVGLERQFALVVAGSLIAEVRSETGQPIRDALIRCAWNGNSSEAQGPFSAQLRTDAYGRVVFKVAQGGSYRVQLLWGDSSLEREVDGAAGEQALVKFNGVPAAAEVMVAVYDVGGEPAISRSVVLADKHQLLSARTNREGLALFDAVPPGSYRLRVQNQAGDGQQSRSVTIGSALRPIELEFNLE